MRHTYFKISAEDRVTPSGALEAYDELLRSGNPVIPREPELD